MSEIKIIGAIERAKSSPNGNPSYWIIFTDYSRARTSADAACAYRIGNPDMRAGCKVVVDFTRADRIAQMNPAPIHD